MRGEHAVRRGVAVSLVAAAVAGCNRSSGTTLLFSDATTLSASTSVGTAPMFAVSPSGKQTVAWVSAPEGGTDGRLYVSVGDAKPAEIRDTLGPIEAHGESPPKLAYAPDGALYAVYTVGKVVPGQRFPLSALRLVKSTDEGKTWSEPVTVTDGAVFGSHSFHALHIADDGTVYVSWLGAPDAAVASAAEKSAHMQMASMQQGMQMGGAHDGHSASASWVTRSTDGGRTWSPRTRVDTGEACPCCRTGLASDKNGTIYMAWRHVFAGSIRDVVVARSTNQGTTWSEPVRVHADEWNFDACPHAGPAIAIDSAGALHITWWTGKEGNAGVFYAKSTDGAKSFSVPVPLGVAKFSRPAHVQIGLASNNRVVVAWDDGTKQVPQVVVRVSHDGGQTFDAATPVSVAGRAATFPVLGIMGDSMAVAWSEKSAAAAKAEAAAMPNMKDPKATQGLHAVGDAEVLVRRAALK
jgi:BNR/Asp-box repeat.